MTRKLYENSDNLEKERAVTLFLEQKWKCEAIKMPIKYGLDYTFKRNNELVGFCEIKCLNYEKNINKGLFLTHSKEV